MVGNVCQNGNVVCLDRGSHSELVQDAKIVVAAEKSYNHYRIPNHQPFKSTVLKFAALSGIRLSKVEGSNKFMSS